MRTVIRTAFLVIVALPLWMCGQDTDKAQNVILVTLDGFRWQEIFTGADSSMLKQQEFLTDGALRDKFWRDDLAERRKALLPFFWTTIAAHGQLYGNRTIGSLANVTNHMWFSYPGYNELLTGAADDEHITSNDKFYNPNTTVLEFLNKKPGFGGKVAAFTSWDCFSYIINDKRSGVFVSAGQMEAEGQLTERERMINELMSSVPNPLGDEVRLDAFTFYYGLEYLKKNKPRVMYISFDETDDFAHGGEYAAYLNSAHMADRFIGELWRYLQSDPQYKDKTTLLITCDHGRGDNAESWRHHGTDVAGSDQIWIAALGPEISALGEGTPGQVYQKQVAATLALLVDQELKTQNPDCGDPIKQILGR